MPEPRLADVDRELAALISTTDGFTRAYSSETSCCAVIATPPAELTVRSMTCGDADVDESSRNESAPITTPPPSTMLANMTAAHVSFSFMCCCLLPSLPERFAQAAPSPFQGRGSPLPAPVYV